MKKILSSKKYVPTCVHSEGGASKVENNSRKRKQIRGLSKPTLLPNWIVRNDSSNVDAILHPDDYLQSPRDYPSPKDHKAIEDKYKGVFKKKKCLAENTCYCKEKKIKPILMSRPNTCPCVEEVEKRITGEDLYRTCRCKDEIPIYSDGESLKKYEYEMKKRCTCLKYSRQRRDYEAFRENEEEEEEEEEEWKEEGGEGEEGEEDGLSVATLMGTKTAGSQTSSTDLEDLIKFRNEHYFETHGTDDLVKDTPEHTCIHQYKLDDRLLPEPTNVDPYGRSRCTICSSPKEGSLPSTMSYRNVSISDKDSKVELKLSKGDVERFGGFVGRFRRPQYFNTLALRQQKMVRYKHVFNTAPAPCVYY